MQAGFRHKETRRRQSAFSSGRPQLTLMVEEISFLCFVGTAILVFQLAQRFWIALQS